MALFEYPPRVLVEFEPEEAEALAKMRALIIDGRRAWAEIDEMNVADAGAALDRVRKALAVEKGPGGSLYRAEATTPADEL